MKKTKWLILVLLIVLALMLAACAASSGGGGEPAAVPENSEPAAPSGGEESASQPETAPTEPEAAPADAEPTPTAEMSDVPIFEGAENYKTTGDGSYISYVVPDTTVEIVAEFYREQLIAVGWDVPTKIDSGFGGSITILRTKPDKRISVTIDTNLVNNGVRVLITSVDR